MEWNRSTNWKEKNPFQRSYGQQAVVASNKNLFFHNLGQIKCLKEAKASPVMTNQQF